MSSDDTGQADHPAAPGTAAHSGPESREGIWALTLGSVGVVYGDIGTSPLYALREALDAAAADGPEPRGGGCLSTHA